MDETEQATQNKFRTVVPEVSSFVGNPVYKLTTDFVYSLNLFVPTYIYIIIVNIYNYYLSAEYI